MPLVCSWISQCETICENNVEEHIFELYSERQLQNKLGYHDRSSNKIMIDLPNSNCGFEITQSLSRLSDQKSNSSSTGFVCWDASIHIADWFLTSLECPIKLSNELTVLELGSGVGGIVACAIQDKVGKYIATDQKHILKLLQENIHNNTTKQNYNIVEFDWENVELGLHNLNELGVTNESIDLVVACDTIYNEYLIPYFISALKCTMSHHSVALVCLQMRDSITFEEFVNTVVEDKELHVYNIPTSLLNNELSKGFVVYAFRKI